MNKESKYLKDSVVGAGGKIATLIGGYGSLWLLTSIFSKSDYGGYVTGLAVVSLLSLAAQFGLRQATIQYVAELSVDDENEIPQYAGAAVTWVGVGSIILCVMIWTLIPHFETILGDQLMFWTRLLVVILPGMALRPVCSGVLQGLERVSEAILINQIFSQGIRLGGLFLAFLYWREPLAVVLAVGASFYLPVLTLGLITRGWRHLNFSGVSVSQARFSAVLLLNSIASQFLKRTDILLLAGLASLSGTGGYNIAWKLAIVAQYGDQILTNVLQPRLSKFLTKGSTEKLIGEFSTVRDLSIVVAVPVLIVMILFGARFLSVFGSYSDQYPVLIVLTLGAIVNATFGPIGQVLLMAKQGKLILLNTFISLSGNILLNYLLIPIYGTLGAATATVLTVYFLTNLIAVVQVRYIVGTDLFDWRTIFGVMTISVTVLTYLFIYPNVIIPVLSSVGVGIALLYRHRVFVKSTMRELV